MVNKKILFISFSIILILLVSPIVHASFLDDILIWLGLKEIPQEIIRTASTDTYIAPDGTTTLIIGSTNYLDRATGKYEPYDWNKETKFYSDDNSLYIEWLDKKVVLDFYILDKNNNTIFLKDLSAEEKTNLNLKTFISKLNNKYIYNHTTTKNSLYLPNGIGYKIITTNTECNPNGNTLICDEQILDFSEAINKQHLKVDIKDNDIKIKPINYSYLVKNSDNKTFKNLSYVSTISFIDPDLTVSGAITMCGLNNSYTNIVVESGGVINVCPYNGTIYSGDCSIQGDTGCLNLSVTTLTVKSGGLINLSLAGWRGSEGIGKGTDSSSYGGGGAYGGIGGTSNSDVAGGSVYGNVTNVTTRGSGGGGGYSGDQGGHGAAFLKVNAVNYINITGKIEANGGSGHGGGSGDGYGGGGSGGGIYLATNYLQGSGNIHAEGGKGCCGGGGTYSGGGGGGRIYVEYCNNSSSSIDFNVTRGYSDPTKTMSTSGTINQTYIATLCPAPNGVPIISESSFYRANIWTTQNVNMSVKCLDNESVNLELNFTWFKNNVLVYTRNVTALNDTVYARGLNYNNYTFGDLINVTVDCWDGADRSSSIMDSTTVTENEPPVPSIISPADSYTTSNRTMGINCSATDNVNISTFRVYGNWTGSFTPNITILNGGISNSTTFNIINLPFGLFKYTCWVNDTSNNVAFATENRTFTSTDIYYPNLTLIKPHAIYVDDEPIEIKYIARDDNAMGVCKYSLDNFITNTTLTCGNNDTINLPAKDYELKFFASDLFGYINTTSRNFTIFNLSAIAYANNNTETNTSNFFINISKGTGNISNITFTYNNTLYGTGFTNAISTSNGQTNLTWLKSLILPFVSSTASNQTQNEFIFNFTLEFNGEFNKTNTSIMPQTINRMLLYSPCIKNNQAVNYTLKDEETGFIINATINNISIEESYYIYLTDPNLTRHYNFNRNATKFYDTGNWSLCISLAWLNAKINSVIQYGATGYNTKFFAVNNLSISNETNITTLYLLSSLVGTNINIFVTDTINNPLPDYIVETRRYMIGEDQYILVESKVTDFNGQTQELLKLNTVYYKFTIKNPSGAVVYDSGNMFVTDTSLYFKISLLPSPFIPIIPLQSLTRSLTWSNATRKVTLTWDDDNDLLSEICLQTYRYEMANISKINEQCSSSSSGTLNYTIAPSITGYYQARAIGTANEDDLIYPLETLDIDLRTGKDIYGLDGVFASLLVIGTMAGIGAFTGSLVATLALTGLGLFIVSIMGYLSVSASAIIGLIIVMIILSVKLKW